MSLQNIFYILAIANLSLWLILSLFCLVFLVSLIKKAKEMENKIEEAKEIFNFTQLRVIKNIVFASGIAGLIAKAYKSVSNKK